MTAKRRSSAGPIELARTLTKLAENACDSGSPALAARRAAETLAALRGRIQVPGQVP